MRETLRSHGAFEIGDQNAESVIEWFDRDDLPSETSDMMDPAIKECQIMVLKWLLPHLSGNVWYIKQIEFAHELIDSA
ncbi:hypothetical protein HK105_204708 [Polyrhizophydium stewartii]|uniref:Uncharacterized protein n=1 Tax=Polyrhizophydium stewartii TaxID=2732419 RepID=A0ABR4N897_9FUNG